MGILKSYLTFMEGNATKGVFSAYESDGPDDTVSFSQRFKQDAADGKISVQTAGDSVTITKNATYSTASSGSSSDTPSLKASDNLSAQVQKTPWRVSLESMKRRIKSEEVIHPRTIPHMTIVVITLDNGYALMGMSAPADPDNYNEEVGIKFAREDALRKMWPLEAYVMREHMSGTVAVQNPKDRWAE